MTLRRQLLIRIWILTVLIILAMSVTYYYLFTRDIRERSYQNVSMAFDLILDDVTTQVANVNSKLDHFVQNSLINPINVVQLLRSQQESLDESMFVWYIKKVMTYLNSIAGGMHEFGTLIDATEILVYDKQNMLLAMYEHDKALKKTGVYLPKVNPDAFIAVQPDDIWYATLQEIDEIPFEPLPESLPMEYQSVIPDSLTVRFGTFRGQVTLQFIMPILNGEEREGVCVIHIAIQQDDVERYSRLSQTRINFFAGTDLSVGTMPQYTYLDQEVFDHVGTVMTLETPELPLLDFSDKNMDGASFYQGTLVIGSQDSRVGAITTLYPRELEEKLKRNFFMVIAGVALLFSLFAAAEAFRLSATIAQPIIRMIQILRKLAQGDLSDDILDRSRMIKSEQWDTESTASELVALARALQEMLDYLQDTVSAAEHIARGEISQNIRPRSPHDVLGYAFQNMTEYLHEMATVASAMSNGDLRRDFRARTELDVLGTAFEHMIAYLEEAADVAQKISVGDIRVSITPKSQRDMFNRYFAETIRYVQEVTDVAEKIADQDLQVEVFPKSSLDVLNTSFRRMVLNLQTMVANIEQAMQATEQQRAEAERQRMVVEQQNWMKAGQAALSNSMRGEQQISELAQNIITYLANYLDAQVGTIYLKEDDSNSLCLTGGYAYSDHHGIPAKIAPGEGLIGQAVREKRIMMVRDIPDGYITVQSSIGVSPPRYLLIAPFLFEGAVKGVVELGSVAELTERQVAFVRLVAENIAIAINTAQTRTKVLELLQQTQIQSEELQQQNEEIEMARKLIEEKAKDLELANKYKSEFLANMSHELRTPLNSLLLLSQFLHENKEGNLTAKQVDFARTIHSAGTELLGLINEILDLSKIEAGKFALTLSSMELSQLPLYIEQHFRHVADNKNLSLTIECDDTLPAFIYTDSQRIEQIMKNFLSNAFKFTSQGGVTVRIARPEQGITLLQSGLDPQHTIAMSVSDTGIGIPEDKLRLIFEAFQQVDGSTSRRYGGTGLGLSISRELASLLGGEIQVASEAGQGSAFTLYLPESLNDDQENITSISPASTTASAMARVTLSQFQQEEDVKINSIRDDRRNVTSTDKTVLIIEDDPTFAKILRDHAHTSGFKCFIAGDGEAGLQLAFQYLPDAILLDIGLPSMDGWAVMQRLQNQLDTQNIPIHVISGQENTLDAINRGAIGALTKPLNVGELERAFQQIEARRSSSVKTLLILEHDDAMRVAIQTGLVDDRKHLSIISARTVQEALDHIQTGYVDCIVLDVGLNDMTGFDFLETVKRMDSMTDIPVIVHTGHELSQDQERTLKQYADSMIITNDPSHERLLDDVSLFLHHVESDLPEAQHRKIQMRHNQDDVLKGRKVLLVDDDVRNVFALTNVLEDKGLNVLMCTNGKEALKALEAHPDVDLVLMDIMMPEMDGYEAMRAIRSQSAFETLPMIALTAKAMKGDRQQCLDAGANDYVSKPIDPDKLLSLLRVWLY